MSERLPIHNPCITADSPESSRLDPRMTAPSFAAAFRTVCELLDPEFSRQDDCTPSQSRLTLDHDHVDKGHNLKAQMNEVDIRINAVDTMLAFLGQLDSTRVRLQHRRDTLARQYGLSLLPNELLSRIFYFVCEELQNSSQTLRNISQVDRRFRETAIGTPVLWSHIHNEQSVDEVRLWLSRSRQTPLHIDHDVARHTFWSKTMPFFRMIVSEAHRIKTISFGYKEDDLLLRLLSEIPPENEMTILEQADVYLEGFLNMPDLRSVAFPCPTPRLRSFIGNDVTIDTTSFKELTHLTLLWDIEFVDGVALAPDPIITILTTVSQLPNLCSFTFDLDTIHFWGLYDIPEHPIVCLPNLRQFSVRIGRSVEIHVIAYLMAHLALPGLHSLDFVFTPAAERTEDITAILDSIGSDENGTLKSIQYLRFVNDFEFDDPIINNQSFHAMLLRMPNLESISLITKHLVSYDTLWMVGNKGGPSLFPKLRMIHLQNCEGVTLNGIRGLFGPRAKWPQFSIADCPQITPQVIVSIVQEMGDKYLGERRENTRRRY